MLSKIPVHQAAALASGMVGKRELPVRSRRKLT